MSISGHRHQRKFRSVGRGLYTATELMRLTRLTRTEVSTLEKKKLLRPLRSSEAAIGKPVRFYSAAEVLKAVIISELRQKGFSPRQVEAVARELEGRGLRLQNAEPYLLTDGYSVYFARTDHDVVDILKHQGQMLLLVPVQERAKSLKLVA